MNTVSDNLCSDFDKFLRGGCEVTSVLFSSEEQSVVNRRLYNICINNKIESLHIVIICTRDLTGII